MRNDNVDNFAFIVGLLTIFSFIVMVGFFGGGALIYAAWNFGGVPVFGIDPIRYMPACWISLGISVLTNATRIRVERR